MPKKPMTQMPSDTAVVHNDPRPKTMLISKVLILQ